MNLSDNGWVFFWGGVELNLRWDDLKLFLAVHEQGSLSGAARVLKLGQPTLSRRIAELEEAVGEALFERQSQGALLTAAGRRLLPAAQSMAEWANEAELSIGKHTHLPQGKVRIAAPPGIAYELAAPLAAKIRKQHPQIQIEVLSGVEVLNLARVRQQNLCEETPAKGRPRRSRLDLLGSTVCRATGQSGTQRADT